jgi:hypothetical protein
MLPLEINPTRHSIIYELGPRQSLRRVIVLNPIHYSSKYILGRLKRYPRSRSVAPLAKDPSSRTGIPVEHSRDAEEPVPVLQMVISFRHPIPETLCVEACDLIVLTTVVADNFSTFPFEGGEDLGPGLDVEGVLLLGEVSEVRVVQTHVHFVSLRTTYLNQSCSQRQWLNVERWSFILLSS